VPYLAAGLRRHPARLPRLWRVPLALLRFALDRDRGRIKGSLISGLLGGLDRTAIAALTERFVAGLTPPMLLPLALAAIAHHRAAGDRLVLLSASTDLYVPPLGAQLGFDEVICTRVAWDGDRLLGTLAGPNLRGLEKRRVIMELKSRHPGSPIAAYANSRSDFDHLRCVEQPTLVNGSGAARRRAARLQIPCADWR
jgi:phosphatidylglycerophosphatase C